MRGRRIALAHLAGRFRIPLRPRLQTVQKIRGACAYDAVIKTALLSSFQRLQPRDDIGSVVLAGFRRNSKAGAEKGLADVGDEQGAKQKDFRFLLPASCFQLLATRFRL